MMEPTARAGDRAYTLLRDQIIDWSLAPGMALAEVDLSEQLGMSRTPVREAIGRLLSDGLVEARGGRGVVVTALSLDDVRQLFELRQALEQRLARLAAVGRAPGVFELLVEEFTADLLSRPDRADYYNLVSRFDAAMETAAANRFLSGALRAVRPQLARVRRISQADPLRLSAAAAEHILIANAVAAGDAELAASATHVHLQQSLQSILTTTPTKGN